MAVFLTSTIMRKTESGILSQDSIDTILVVGC